MSPDLSQSDIRTVSGYMLTAQLVISILCSNENLTIRNFFLLICISPVNQSCHQSVIVMALLLRSVALAPFWYPAVASAVEHSLVQYTLQVKCKVGVVGKNPSDSYDFLAIFKHRLSAESTGLWPARRPMAG